MALNASHRLRFHICKMFFVCCGEIYVEEATHVAKVQSLLNKMLFAHHCCLTTSFVHWCGRGIRIVVHAYIEDNLVN